MSTDVVDKIAEQTIPVKKTSLTFSKAIELGEYEPNFLEQFPEFSELTRPSQYEYVKKAIENRIKHIWVHWSELANLPDMSIKPQIRKAMEKLEQQHKKVMADKERLYIEFASSDINR